MIRLILSIVFIAVLRPLFAQTKVVSLGIFTGASVPFTWDEGINKDPRYRSKYDIKMAPFGAALGLDFEHFGFIVTPSLVNAGQNFYVINTVGGQVGERKINTQYLNVPLGAKYNLIDLAFFKVSVVGSVAVSYLLNGKETISHRESKLRFPSEVYPLLQSDPAYSNYIIEYDGVSVPEVNNFSMLSKNDFNPIQFSVALGFRSDWDVSDNWRVSFDFRANYVFHEPRAESYLSKVKNYQTPYDIYGVRKDIYGNLSIGIARYIEINNKNKDSKKTKNPFKPKRYPTRNRN